MRVLHIGLASHYTEGMLYQDNIIPDLNAKSGHKVVFVTDTYVYKNGVLREVPPEARILSNGVRLIRLSYDHIINDFITKKIQKARLLQRILNDFEPDTILYHGVCGYEMMDVAKYVKEHPNTLFYMDSHEDFGNTAKTWLSRIAYKYIHGFFLYKALPYIKKILYVGYDCKVYLKEMYNIKDNLLELYPLGGILLNKEKQLSYRNKIIEDLGFPKDAIICAHSGKMDRGKKTEDLIRAFSRVSNERLRLLIFGSIPDEMKSTLEPLINADERIFFLGWKTAVEQEHILGATDLYLQPGTYSSTAQIAMCDGCALLVNNGYRSLMEDAAFYEEDANGIEKVLKLYKNYKNFLPHI